MDFKMKTDKNNTPKSKIIDHVLNAGSPFNSFPKFSTPPSKFGKIFNPFSQHLVDRLHLPTLSSSPSVFQPRERDPEKFKWSIDNISKFQPADIDETTIDQHVFDEDPHLESIVQDKIDKFFSKKVIVPSPLSLEVRSRALVCSESPMRPKKESMTCSTQTTLTLPPILPPHLEEALKPYFSYCEEQDTVNSSLHRVLFDTPRKDSTLNEDSICSPALSTTGLSPIRFNHTPFTDVRDNSLLKSPDCTLELSPIDRKSPKHSKSACRLDFSEQMSIDASMIVPDIRNSSNVSIKEINIEISTHENTINSSANWDMEYKQLSLSPTPSNNSTDKMDISNTTTPHSKLFTSQRKRLSESFKDDELEEDFLQLKEDRKIKQINKKQSVTEDFAESGYMTGSIQLKDLTWDPHVFASTPSKTKNIVF